MWPKCEGTLGATTPQTVHDQFEQALHRLIEQVKHDRSILAAVLCGSLSHDTVWAKSDIDLILITIDDDKKIDRSILALYADGLNVHASRMTRNEFRTAAESALRNSFMHSLLAKGRLLYTHDPTIQTLFSSLTHLGERDAEFQLLRAGIGALLPVYKAHKWFITRGDLDYTALWILYAATSLARIEVIGRGCLAGREVIPQALELNPEFFSLIYTGMLNGKKTRKGVQVALDAVDEYLAARAEALFAKVIDYLRDAGEVRSSTEIENWFKRNYDIDCVTAACEYLADLGLIAKVSTPVQLTRRSNISVEELAFAYRAELGDGR